MLCDLTFPFEPAFLGRVGPIHKAFFQLALMATYFLKFVTLLLGKGHLLLEMCDACFEVVF